MARTSRDYLRDLLVKQILLRHRILIVLSRHDGLSIHDLHPECFTIKDRFDYIEPSGAPYGLACIQSHLWSLRSAGHVTRNVHDGVARWSLVDPQVWAHDIGEGYDRVRALLAEQLGDLGPV